MRFPLLKYALAVFLGGASYGAMGTVAKSAFAAGFAWPQTVMSQALFGTLLFGLAFAIEALRNRKAAPMDARKLLRLAGTGMVTATTGVLYSIALSRLPVAVAITLLFQFTWIGIVIQVVATRKPPHAAQVAAAAVIMAGTVLASGLLSSDVDFASFDLVGIACALLSAVSCAAFMYLSGRVGSDMPPFQRGFFICLGSLAVASSCARATSPRRALPGHRGLWRAVGGDGAVRSRAAVRHRDAEAAGGRVHHPRRLRASCGILLSFLVLGEGIDVVQTAGVVAILAGVAIAQAPTMRVRARRRDAEARRRSDERL